jgi:hypothetical protein
MVVMPVSVSRGREGGGGGWGSGWEGAFNPKRLRSEIALYDRWSTPGEAEPTARQTNELTANAQRVFMITTLLILQYICIQEKNHPDTKVSLVEQR